jgi:hypothetical protein
LTTFRLCGTPLSALADSFEDALADRDVRETTWAEVRSAAEEGQQAMLRVVADVLGELLERVRRAWSRRI